MIRIDEVRERIDASVPALTGKLFNAGDWANVIEKNHLPQVTPAGFVLPGGIEGGQAQMAAGAFIQPIRDTVIVVVAVRVAGDPLANRAIDEATPLVREVVNAVCGWGPGESPGVFVLARAELVGAKDGALLFQIDFALDDQLRIIS